MDDNTFDGIYFVPVASTLDLNLGKLLKDIEPYIQGALNIGSQVFANNNTNKLGSAVNLLGSTMGGWKGTALQVAGNLINGLIGSNINKLNEAVAEAELSRMRNYNPMANSNASLISQINNFTTPYYTSKFFGTQGLLNHDADDLAEHFNALMHMQIPRIQDLFNNNAYRLAVNAADNQRNFNLSALGGPLHAYGGPTLPVQGADWTNGIDYIGAGGSHESNPHLGVPVSIALDGQPNLVEEGEAIFNDYVFSKRIKVPKSFKRKYALGGSIKTFADAALKLGEESKERPNDPISKRGLFASMSDLAMLQELIRQKQQAEEELATTAALGGHLHRDGAPNLSIVLKSPPKLNTQLYQNAGEWWNSLSLPKQLTIMASVPTMYTLPASEEDILKMINDATPDIYDENYRKDVMNFGRDPMQVPYIISLHKQFADPRGFGFNVPEDKNNIHTAVGRMIDRAHLNHLSHLEEQTTVEPAATTPETVNFDIQLESTPDSNELKPYSGKLQSPPVLSWRINPRPEMEAYTSMRDAYANLILLSKKPAVNELENSLKLLNLIIKDTEPYVKRINNAENALLAQVLTDEIGLTNKPNYGPGDALRRAGAAASNYMPVSYTPRGELLLHYDPYNINALRALLLSSAAGQRRALLNAVSPLSSAAQMVALNQVLDAALEETIEKAINTNLLANQAITSSNNDLVKEWAAKALEADNINASNYGESLKNLLSAANAAAELDNKAYEFSKNTKDTTKSTLLNNWFNLGRESLLGRMLALAMAISGGYYFDKDGKPVFVPMKNNKQLKV